jgi:stress response protein YsnF
VAYTDTMPNDLIEVDEIRITGTSAHPFNPNGREVVDRNGQRIGTIRAILASQSMHQAYFAVVDGGSFASQREVAIPLSLLQFEREPNRVHALFSQEQLQHAPEYRSGAADFAGIGSHWANFAGTAGQQSVEETRVPIVDEDARVSKEEREVGAVEIRKTSEVETRRIQEPVTYTRVTAEVRDVPADQQAAALAGASPLREGETIRVPIEQEELVVEKVQTVKEAVIRKEQDTRMEERDVQLRHDHVEVEEEGDVDAVDDLTRHRR